MTASLVDITNNKIIWVSYAVLATKRQERLWEFKTNKIALSFLNDLKTDKLIQSIE